MRDGWVYKKLGDCFPYIKNGANIKQIKDADGLPITRIETLSNGLFNRDKMGYANIMEIGKYSEYVLEDQDLLMSHINSKTYIGRTVEYKKEGDEVIIQGMNLLKLKADKTIIIPRFFYYYSFSQKFKFDVSCVRKDAVNQSSMAIGDLKRFNLPIPPISTQQQIVSELDLLNHIIDQKRLQLKEYDALAESIFYDMFGDPVENPNGWEVKTIGDLCRDVKYGTSKPAVEGGQYPYLRMNNITSDGHLDLKDLKKIDIPDEEFEKCVVRYGDILFNRTNSLEHVGKTCMFDLAEPMIIAGYIIRIRLIDSAEPLFVAKFFNMPSTKKVLRKMAKGAVNQANINSKEMQTIPIPLPPLTLQRQFAAKIESIEHQKQLLKESIKETEMLFQSRMDYWFNG